MPEPAASNRDQPEHANAGAGANTHDGFWRRRVVRPIIAQLTQGITPDRLAITCGAAVAGGLFPFIGATTVLCFVAALVFRLNQPIIHVLNQLLWPVQVAMVAVYVQVGAWIYGQPAIPFEVAEVKRLFLESQAEFWSRFGWLGVHAFTAWAISVPLLLGGTFYLTRPVLRRLAARSRPTGAQ